MKIEFDEIKEKILKRDNNQCQIFTCCSYEYKKCTNKCDDRDVYHIDSDVANNELDNLITVCSIHYERIHNTIENVCFTKSDLFDFRGAGTICRAALERHIRFSMQHRILSDVDLNIINDYICLLKM